VSFEHPGRTPAQRAFLDQLGGGNPTPTASRTTIRSLLNAGLIVCCGDKIVGADRFGAVKIPMYEMPLHVHIAWCKALAAEFDAMSPEEQARLEHGEGDLA
jgi:hypothetical protein